MLDRLPRHLSGPETPLNNAVTAKWRKWICRRRSLLDGDRRSLAIRWSSAITDGWRDQLYGWLHHAITLTAPVIAKKLLTTARGRWLRPDSALIDDAVRRLIVGRRRRRREHDDNNNNNNNNSAGRLKLRRRLATMSCRQKSERVTREIAGLLQTAPPPLRP